MQSIPAFFVKKNKLMSVSYQKKTVEVGPGGASQVFCCYDHQNDLKTCFRMMQLIHNGAAAYPFRILVL